MDKSCEKYLEKKQMVNRFEKKWFCFNNKGKIPTEIKKKT